MKMTYVTRIEQTFKCVKQSFGTEELVLLSAWMCEVKQGKLHPCTATEALHRPYGP
jgi:hypothetical protein